MSLPLSDDVTTSTEKKDDIADAGCSRSCSDAGEPEVQIVDWDGPNDPGNPYNWSSTRKWLVVGVAMIGSLLLPLNSTSITIAANEINADFHISDAHFTNSYWPVTSWSVGGAIFILIALPLMEDLGVRKGYLSFYVFFLLMLIPQALAPNFATLIVTRFFSGGCVTFLANTVSSIIPDLWQTERDRSLPVSIYVAFYVLGSTLGPVIFAGVVQHIGDWRWIFYIQLIMYGACLPLFILLLRETRGTVILRHRAAALRRQTPHPTHPIRTRADLTAPRFTTLLVTAVTRPPYLFTTEPVLLAAGMWSAFSYGTVFLFTQSVTQVFAGVYGWSEAATGYAQGAVAVGEVVGWGLSLFGIRLFLDSAKRNTECPGRPIPEARLYVAAVVSLVGLAGGMFVYAWTAVPGVPWIAPVIGLAMVGAGCMVVVLGAADYVIDVYADSGFAGSAISAVAALENIVAGFLPLAAQSMYGNLGFPWASSLLGFVGFVLSMAPLLFIWKGRWFREKSPFMRTGGQLKEDENGDAGGEKEDATQGPAPAPLV